MPSEPVYEIKPLRWREKIDGNWECHIPGYGYITVMKSPDGFWGSSNQPIMFQGADKAKAAAERWYRRQLRKALRRVRR